MCKSGDVAASGVVGSVFSGHLTWDAVTKRSVRGTAWEGRPQKVKVLYFKMLRL